MDERETLRHLIVRIFLFCILVTHRDVCAVRRSNASHLFWLVHVVTTFISVAVFIVLLWLRSFDLSLIVLQVLRILKNWLWAQRTHCFHYFESSQDACLARAAFVRAFSVWFSCNWINASEKKKKTKLNWLFVWLGYCLLVLWHLASELRGNYGTSHHWHCVCVYVDVDSWCDQLYVSIWKIIWPIWLSVEKILPHSSDLTINAHRLASAEKHWNMFR